MPPDFRGARRVPCAGNCVKGGFELVEGCENSLVITHLRADYRAGGLGMFQVKVRGTEMILS
jgi:hypothetical protein